jgi:ATP-dependent Clp protease ATP-binding subunit ClpA
MKPSEMPTMYDRFTDRARKVMQLANQEAQRFNHEYVGTEHILLGLVKEGSGVAANALKNLDIDLRKIRLEVDKIVQPGPGGGITTGRMPQTPRAKKVIEYAIEEARQLHHNYVGTEHLLLGLMREEEGVAAQLLMNLGIKPEDVWKEVRSLLGWCSISPASRWNYLGAELADLPAKVRQAFNELKAQIERLQEEKVNAVSEQDFEKAAYLRDQADKLKRKQAALLRQWHTECKIDPAWLSWNGGTVAKIARVIDEEDRWDDLPILADALEEAGCTNEDILSHCRQPGKHTHGCWVLDLLLSQE